MSHQGYNPSKFHPTLHGLKKWFEHVFEHLGWMVLASIEGHHRQVEDYIESIYRLKHELEIRAKRVREEDRKYDLEQLIIMVDDLQERLPSIFPKESETIPETSDEEEDQGQDEDEEEQEMIVLE